MNSHFSDKSSMVTQLHRSIRSIANKLNEELTHRSLQLRLVTSPKHHSYHHTCKLYWWEVQATYPWWSISIHRKWSDAEV